MDQKIIIFDTTLRDGEQSLQFSLNKKEKLKIALSLELLGVDVMEVGFPISSPGDFESVKYIANNIKNSCICVLARCINKDIDVAAESIRNANESRIHIFLATSSLHLKYKLKKDFNEIIDMAVYFIKYASRYTNNIEFSCEDAGRTNLDNLCRIVESSINAGANTINIPDTVGYTIPNQFGYLISNLYKRVPNIDKAIISVHCHNDLGMAVGNSITAIQYGARQIEGTINGIGERAGNTALEEIIMTIKLRKDILNVYTNINCEKIYDTSKIVSKICKIPIPINKAIVGKNAFSHSSGIHQDGILKNRQNYEIITPEVIGLKDIKLNLTSRSGRAVIKYYMNIMGYKECDYNINILYNDFLHLADKKGKIFDYDLESLAFIGVQQSELEYFHLVFFSIYTCSNNISTVLIKIFYDNNIHVKIVTSTNPIYALCDALYYITNLPIELKKYNISINGYNDKNIFSESNIKIKYCGRLFHGFNKSTKSILESFVKAIICSLNNVWRSCQVKKKLNYNIKK